MRPIDADRFKETILAFGVRGAGWSDEERESDVFDMIDNEPSIEPGEEITRLCAELKAMKTEYKVAMVDLGEVEGKLSAMTADRDALRARCAAAEGDLRMVCAVAGEPCAACHHCCDIGPDFPCAISDAWCYGEKWEWRGLKKPGDAQSAPGGAL